MNKRNMMDVSYSSSLEYSSSYSYGRNDSSDAAQIIPLSVAYSFVFLTGVIGNSIVLFAIYRSRRLHTITCIFLANMAIVDLIVCLLIVPIQIVQEFINHWPYGEAICKLISYLMLLNPTCSVFTLTLISFERFYVVKYPLQAKAVLTFRRAKIALLIVWVFAIFFTLPNIFKQGVIPLGDIGICKVIWDPHSLANRLYVTCNMLFLLIIPVVMMTLAYASVIRALYKNKKATAGRKQSSAGRIAVTYKNGATRLQVQQNEDFSSTSTYTPDASPARSIVRDENGNKNKAKRLRFRIGGTKEPKDEDADKIKRIVLMLVIIVLLFVISWAPLLTVNFLLKFAIITPSTRTITMLSSSTHLLAFANSCFNPFVYALLSKNFRESTKQVLRQCCGGTDTARFQNRPSLSSTRLSRLGSSMPRWKSLRGANETKEDYV